MEDTRNLRVLYHFTIYGLLGWVTEVLFTSGEATFPRILLIPSLHNTCSHLRTPFRNFFSVRISAGSVGKHFSAKWNQEPAAGLHSQGADLLLDVFYLRVVFNLSFDLSVVKNILS